MRVAGLILAGGKATRMGGVDKGLQCLNGKPLIEYVINQILPQVDTLYISANRNINQYQKLGFTVIEDTLEWQGLGPLAGIVSVIPLLPNDVDGLLIVPCDMPFLPINLLQKLQSFPVAYPCDISGQAQFSCIWLSKPLFSSVKISLQDHQLSLQSWLNRITATTVHFTDTDMQCWLNFNTLNQL